SARVRVFRSCTCFSLVSHVFVFIFCVFPSFRTCMFVCVFFLEFFASFTRVYFSLVSHLCVCVCFFVFFARFA
ncbi:hypothetical protein S83_063512, partial [Arachis hypogaea]